jgi:hypothetical protein
LLVSRVVLTAAESARQAQEKKVRLNAMVAESQKLMETIYETSNKNTGFKNLPEADRLELYSLAEEMNRMLNEITKEGEAT